VNLGSDTITRLRGQSRDGFGNLAGSASELDVDGCSVQPTSGTESTDTGDLLVTTATAYAPAGTDLVATDRVRWLGDVYEVDGPPARWRDDEGTEDHVQVQLKLTQGQG
jgi:hypothetical protein